MAVSTKHLAIQLAIGLSVLMSACMGSMQDESETVAAAATKAFDKGEQELVAGNHTEAITLLKTAVRIEPNNARYQHKLAIAFLAAKKYHEMWVHLRKATVLELGNQQYSQDFLRMWRLHDLQGTLNIGSSAGVILKAMGEPDQRVENKQMKRWVYGFMAVEIGQSGVFRVLDLRGYTAEAAQEVELLSVETDSSEWKAAHHQVSKIDDNLELTRKNEQVQQWTELFSKQRFPMMSRSGATVEGMVETMRKSLLATDPKAEFNIISKSPEAIHYHWKTTSTKDNPAQHEIAKIIKGQKDFYRVAYVKKTTRLDDQEFARWSKVIGDAKLVPINSQPTEASGENEVQTEDKVDLRASAWEFGESLSFAALVRGKHGPDKVVIKTLGTVSKNARDMVTNKAAIEEVKKEIQLFQKRVANAIVD